MISNKSIIKSIFNNLTIILCINFLFLLIGIITYRIPMSLNISNSLSIFAVQFYASILQVIVIFLILKYGLKKKIEIINEEQKTKKILFDILIFLFTGLLVGSLFLGGLTYLEIITNNSPNYNNEITRDLLDGMQFRNLDIRYSIIAGVILAPMAEELFFRKGVFKYFSDKDVSSRNLILLSGISFGLAHLIGFAKPASSIIIGITFAVIYVITKNIIYPIIGHGLNNLMPFITTIFRDNSRIEDVQTYIEVGRVIEIKGAIIISLSLLGITSILSYIKRRTIISSDFRAQLKKVFTDK